MTKDTLKTKAATRSVQNLITMETKYNIDYHNYQFEYIHTYFVANKVVDKDLMPMTGKFDCYFMIFKVVFPYDVP